MRPMPDASPRPPKPESRTESMTTIEAKFKGTADAGFAFDKKADENTIIAPPRSVNALPRITMIAEMVMPTERGNGHPFRSSSPHHHAHPLRSRALVLLTSTVAHSLCARHSGFHSSAELVDLVRRSVDVRAHPNAVETRSRNRCHHNVALVDEHFIQLSWLEGVKVDRAERARLVRLQFDQHSRARNFAQALRPAILQVAEAREFSLRANLLVELQRLQRGVMHGRRVCADFFEFANIFVQRLDRKSTRLNSSHTVISYAVFCLKKKKKNIMRRSNNTL